jgi:hypothetical protein
VQQDEGIAAVHGLGGTDVVPTIRQTLASLRGFQEQEGRGVMNSPYAPPFGPAERPRAPLQTAAEIEQDEQERYERVQGFESRWARYESNFGYRYEDDPDLDYENYSNPNNFEHATAGKEITDEEVIDRVIDTRPGRYEQFTALSGGNLPNRLFETIDNAEAAGPWANDRYHRRNYSSLWQ